MWNRVFPDRETLSLLGLCGMVLIICVLEWVLVKSHSYIIYGYRRGVLAALAALAALATCPTSND